MARIDLDLAHSYRPKPVAEADYALLPLQMSFDDGGAYALLGPSGCGKTTMLNLISGLVQPSQGSVRFDGRDVTGLSPQQRNIAQVFQFPVIYDTMTVGENLAFPLHNRGVAPQKIRQRVGVVAEMLELSDQLDQRAAGLAADAKQQISLGRGLVREHGAAGVAAGPPAGCRTWSRSTARAAKCCRAASSVESCCAMWKPYWGRLMASPSQANGF